MASRPTYLSALVVLLLAVGIAPLTGCSPRTAVVVGAGGAALGAVSSAGSAAGSALGSAGSAASNAVSSVRGSQPVGDVAVQSGAAVTPSAPTVRAYQRGIANCLDTIGTTEVASALISEGWAADSSASVAADGRSVAIARDGVRGTVIGGRSCSFAAEALVGPTGRAIAFDALRDHVGTGLTPIAPTAQAAPCGGYAFDLDGQPARMNFTAAPGGDCSGAGAGVTISLI